MLLFFVKLISVSSRALKEAEDRVEGKRLRLLGAEASSFDPLAAAKLLKRHNETRAAWKDRKDKCVDAVEMIADGMEKKAKFVMVSGFSAYGFDALIQRS